MKYLWYCNFRIFHTILINDVSHKIVLNGLQFESYGYLIFGNSFFLLKTNFWFFILMFMYSEDKHLSEYR
jgi:hypothetical protein